MSKPLQINPIKLSQPMGATLAFLGIKNCMPLMHGAQGCASFTKVFFTRHFSDPIAIQTTAVNDITAVLDGGDYAVSESIKNITKKVKLDLVGLFTTGMTETKGDDIKGASFLVKDEQKIVYVNTPDFEGGLESGFSKVITALIEQIIKPCDEIDSNKALIIPNVNLKPIDVEKIKDTLELFGFEALALPDLSESLDGHLGLKQGALSSGGISITEVENLANSSLVITIGESVKINGEKLREKNEKITHLHFDSLGGLIANDEFYKKILEYKNIQTPPPSIVKWRKRLQDALLDTHFAIGSMKFLIAGEPDELLSISQTINEAGAKIVSAISTTKSKALEKVEAENVIIGDLDDAEKFLNEVDVIITNFHGHRIAKINHKAFMLRGFPNYEEVGNQLKYDVLYEGNSYMLFELANIINHYKEENNGN